MKLLNEWVQNCSHFLVFYLVSVWLFLDKTFQKAVENVGRLLGLLDFACVDVLFRWSELLYEETAALAELFQARNVIVFEDLAVCYPFQPLDELSDSRVLGCCEIDFQDQLTLEDLLELLVREPQELDEMRSVVVLDTEQGDVGEDPQEIEDVERHQKTHHWDKERTKTANTRHEVVDRVVINLDDLFDKIDLCFQLDIG